MPALPERFVLVKSEIVLDEVDSVLLVKVWVAVRPTRASETSGNVKVVPSVPSMVSELFTVSVLSAAMFRVLFPLLVIVKPLIVKRPVLVIVTLSPSPTLSPLVMEIPAPPTIFIEELESAEFGIFVKVFSIPEIVLLLIVCERLSIKSDPSVESFGIVSFTFVAGLLTNRLTSVLLVSSPCRISGAVLCKNEVDEREDRTDSFEP